MSEHPIPRENIVLIGFMGSGKSSIGRLLARTLRFQFSDTDEIVEQRTGMEIRDVFAQHGEPYFRERETAALESLSLKRRQVISTGGGIVTQPRNLPLLQNLGWVVLLTASPDVIFERVSRNKKRPLLSTADPRASMMELLNQRQALYENSAHFTVDSTTLDTTEVATIIANKARRVFGWAASSK